MRNSKGFMECMDDRVEAIADFIDAVAMVGEYLLDTEDSEMPIERKEHERELIATGGWQCKCGQVNASYVGSCQCGGTKQKDTVPYKYKELIETEPEKPAPTSGWICLCGKKNSNYNMYCSCGGVKTDGTPYDDGQPAGQAVTELASEEIIETQEPAEEIIETPKPVEKIIAVPELIEEVNELQEPVKIVLPQSTKPQGKPIQERTNKRFDNPFHEEEKEWKCSRCGTIKPFFMPICECGMSKRDNG